MKKLIILSLVLTAFVACTKMEPLAADKVSYRQAQNMQNFYEPYTYNNCSLAAGYSKSSNQSLNDSWIYTGKVMGISETFLFKSKDGKKNLSFSFPYLYRENSAYFTYTHWNLEENSWNQSESPGGVQMTGNIMLGSKTYAVFLTCQRIYVRHRENQHFIEMCDGNCMFRLNGTEVNSDMSINLMWEENR